MLGFRNAPRALVTETGLPQKGLARDERCPSMNRAFFKSSIADLARNLIGARLLVNGVGGTIVETEAYDAADPASHSFTGPTKRNASMFGPQGCAYVYRIYGAHWCLNIVGGQSPGAAVLVRALEPTHGLELLRKRRGADDLRKLCSGPGKLCQALAIRGDYDGLWLDHPPFDLAPCVGGTSIACGSRVGISKAVGTLWRFGWRVRLFEQTLPRVTKGDPALEESAC